MENNCLKYSQVFYLTKFEIIHYPLSRPSDIFLPCFVCYNATFKYREKLMMLQSSTCHWYFKNSVDTNINQIFKVNLLYCLPFLFVFCCFHDFINAITCLLFPAKCLLNEYCFCPLLGKISPHFFKMWHNLNLI